MLTEKKCMNVNKLGFWNKIKKIFWRNGIFFTFAVRFKKVKIYSDEKDISTFTEKKKKQARFSWTNGYCQWTPSAKRTSRKRT